VLSHALGQYLDESIPLAMYRVVLENDGLIAGRMPHARWLERWVETRNPILGVRPAEYIERGGLDNLRMACASCSLRCTRTQPRIAECTRNEAR
jgi:hypothetical protein